uniref:Uncharacterized protein n=1 Tax=Anguilla anguilla TaxID=7936 RepID=A0A0E9VD48_ANGAN
MILLSRGLGTCSPDTGDHL